MNKAWWSPELFPVEEMLPVNEHKVEALPCDLADSIANTLQNWNPGLWCQCKTRKRVCQSSISIGRLLPGNAMPLPKHLDLGQCTCAEEMAAPSLVLKGCRQESNTLICWLLKREGTRKFLCSLWIMPSWGPYPLSHCGVFSLS